MFVCLDIETTGLDADNDHVIEVAIIRFDHEKILEEWSSLVKAPVKIPEFSTRLTGITDKMLETAPLLEDLAEIIRERIGDAPIVGHYIFFDVNFLSKKGIHFENEQLDSCQLAQVLLPNEASYSLEVLANKLAIEQTDAHRATDDVKANIELFWQLADHIRALPKEEKESLRPILEKSTWPWARHILKLLTEEPKNAAAENALMESVKLTGSSSSETHVNLSELTKDLQTPFLFEEASHTYQDLIDYALTLEGDTVLAVPDTNKFPQNKELGVIKHPNQYLDEDRFLSLLRKDTLDTAESMLCAKIALWLRKTKTGEKSELRIVKEEKNLWFEVCCQESDTPKSFFKRAAELALSKKILGVNHLHFLKEHSRKNPSLQISNNLVIGQTEELVKTLEYAWHMIFRESHFTKHPLADKISILFGFLGIFFQNHGEGHNQWSTLTVEDHLRSSQEWNRVGKAAEALEEALEEASQDNRYLIYLCKILQKPGDVIWLNTTQDQEILLHAFPENPAKLFKERVWTSPEKLHLFCHHGNMRDDFTFLKSELALPENLTVRESRDIIPLPFLTPKTRLSSPNEIGNPKDIANEISLQLKDPQNKFGNVMLLTTSKKSAEDFFYALPSALEGTDRKLFVQNLSGGMGKIFKMAEETDGHNLFVGHEYFLDFLLGEGVKLDLLIIHRLPFSKPDEPIQRARASHYDDQYKEFTVPQAGLRFQSNLNKFLGNEWKRKYILVADPRISNYEGLFY